MIELPNTKTLDNNHKSFNFSKQSHVNLYALHMFNSETIETYGYPYLSSYRRTFRNHSHILSDNASPCQRDCRLKEKIRSIKKAGNARFFLSR